MLLPVIVSSALLLLLFPLSMFLRIVNLIRSIRKKRVSPRDNWPKISANPKKYFRYLPPTRMSHLVTGSHQRSSATESERSRIFISKTYRDKNDKKAAKTMVFLGSGGHTTEMIRLLQELNPDRYSPVIYVVADSDSTSISRLREFITSSGRESGDSDNCDCHHNDEMKAIKWRGRWPADNNSDENGDDEVGKRDRYIDDESDTVADGKNEPTMMKYSTNTDEKQATTLTKLTNHTKFGLAPVYKLPRAREVNQSYVTSVFSTIRSFFQTVKLIWETQPELLLCNGPGTCVPLIYSVFLFRVLGLFRCNSISGHSSDCKVIFVESLCRVGTLSLSGKLVYPLVDKFVVHWPSLKKNYPMVEICDLFVDHSDNSFRKTYYKDRQK